MVLANIARMTTATTGTGTITLGSAVTSFLTFAQAGITNGQTVSYAIEDGNNREVGRGVYTSTGTTLTRSVLRSTNSNAAISLSGSAQVFITALAEDIITSAALPTIIVRDEKTVNTDGGASSASWASRDLNTVVVNTVSGASLASNQVTLPAGTYEVTGWDTASQSDGHRCRLHIVADGTTLLTGSTDRGVSGVNMTGYSQINGRFTIASSKAINLQTYCQTAKAVDGFGKAANVSSTPEVYSSLKFVKVA